ncbi:hydroxyproline O-galactosyltransferase GALT3 isoform X2 [Dendrobium catenatum]|uniref:hydroxyproline O-galactosyltransferase GALT3 isoform X2 n=1 Tax=Dendrobium catenatum TaxID=906689 RepID=UPI0009F516A4|nr:hydroxyproline O-galactosyltransferase GALT3 isoform X2 [Dendrobium catenatum]
MKRWSGGILILSLAVFLLLRYSFSPNSATPRRISTRKRYSSPPLSSLTPLISSAEDTVPNPTPTLAWPYLLSLLSRADSLPTAAAAAREATAVWSNLAADIQPKPANASVTSCPFSAIAVSGSNGTFLTIPCGLTENSAINVVAIPSGPFYIDLVGSGAPPHVVLRYNVSLGDSSTIAESSWTPELGWIDWQWCPEPDGNLKVDELVRCNVHSGESILEDRLNGSVVEGKKRSSHMSINFPFTEGQAFTSTLWAGLDGFHMTVNGRHETSFMYKESLDPWSVSGVKVEGALEVLSCFANGLPFFEDLALVGDVEKLKAPKIAKRRAFMLVGVFSSSNNFARRQAIRKSWMQYEAVRSGDVAVCFLIGLTKLLPAKYIMKTDDDAFVRIDEVISALKKNDPNGLLYGLISFESSPHRDKDSKWYISEAEWSNDSYPPWAHGPGYIISRDIAKFVVKGHEGGKLKLFKLEDVAMGIWIQEFKENGGKVNYVNDERFYNAGCESDYVLAHYQGPRKLLCLWDKLQREHEAICCE